MLACVVVRQDHCAGGVQPSIPISVVGMPVGVDQVFDGIGAEGTQGFHDSRPGDRETRIDQKLTVAPGQYRNVASRALEDVDIAAEVLESDLRVRGRPNHCRDDSAILRQRARAERNLADRRAGRHRPIIRLHGSRDAAPAGWIDDRGDAPAAEPE